MNKTIGSRLNLRQNEAKAQAEEDKKEDDKKEETSMKAAVDEAMAAKIPSFRGIRLNQIIRKDGTKWLPNADGLFVPSNLAEAEMVEYYITIGRLEQAADEEAKD